MRTKRLDGYRLALVVPLLCVVGGTAHANEPASQPVKGAKQLYSEGEAHYGAGRYLQAAKKFEEAYALSPRPPLLFNLGNTYEKLGEFKKAADRLRTYLETGNLDARGRQLVSERIGRLEAASEQKQRDREELREAKQSREAAPLEGKKRSNLLSYILFSVGGAAITTAIILGVSANSAGDAAESACKDGYCPQTAQSDIDSQKGLALGSDIALGIGIAAVGAGAILLVRNLMRKSESESPKQAQQKPTVWLTGAPNPAGGAVVRVVGRF